MSLPRGNQYKSQSKPHRLDDPGFAKEVARLIVNGHTRQEIADACNLKDLETVTRWKRDPRVKSHCLKLVDERIIQITRKVDAEIEERLQNSVNLTTRELLEIRKEFLGGAKRAVTEKDDGMSLNESMQALEENPELLEDLDKLIKKATAKG